MLLLTEEFSISEVILQLQHMVDLVQDQLDRVLRSFQNRDLSGALEVWGKDQEIDTVNSGLFREMLTYMMENPRNISFFIHMLFINRAARASRAISRYHDSSHDARRNSHCMQMTGVPALD